MNLKRLLSVIGVFLLTLATAVSCVKDTDYELPDLKETVPTFDGKIVDFTKVIGAGTAEVTEYANNEAFQGYVVSSDEGGNFYKKIYLQNEAKTQAIAIAIDKSGLYADFPIGAKVQVRLKGLTTQINNGILETGYQIHTSSSGRKSVGNMPEVVYKKHVFNLQETLKPQTELNKDITEVKSVKNDGSLGQLITLKGVSFSKTDIGKKFHIKENDRFQGTDYTLTDAKGETVKFRTSRYAKFINETVPAGKLDITGILTKFGSNYQFLINNITDIKVVGNSDNNNGNDNNVVISQFPYNQNFEKDPTSEGWKVITTKGERKWEKKEYKGAHYMRMTAFVKDKPVTDVTTWLVTPKLNITVDNYILKAKIADAHKNGNPLTIKYSQNYDGGNNPEAATWTAIGANEIDAIINNAGSYDNKYEEVSLALPKGDIYVAFVYTSQAKISTTIDVESVYVGESNTTPTPNPNPDEVTLKTVQEIRTLYTTSDVTITDNWKMKVVITSDKTAKNINDKNAFGQDETAGIALRFNVAHNFAVGDEIEILLKDLKLSKFNNLLQISGITEDKTKKVGTKAVTAKTITLEQALSGNFESQLVTISDVQFKNKNAKYGDDKGSQWLTNCTKELTLYTAKDAVFANDKVSDKRGSITGNLSVFKNTVQLVIRTTNDVNFTTNYTDCNGNNNGDGNSGGNSGTQGGVFFSEYIEGSSSNKYLEIYNGTDKEIDLSKYSIKLYTNGKTQATNTLVLNATGVEKLAVGATLVIKNSNAKLTLPNGVTAYANDVCNYNGDDALELLHENTVIDVIGKVGEQPAVVWEVAGTPKATADKTLRRKANVKKGNTDWANAAANEWEVLNKDTVDGLGKR